MEIYLADPSGVGMVLSMEGIIIVGIASSSNLQFSSFNLGSGCVFHQVACR